MIKARFNSNAPTNEYDKEDKEDSYEQLQQAVAKVPQHDMLFIIEDMNAEDGAENSNCERALQVQEAYKGKDMEVKKSARSDKRSFVEGLATEAECAAARGELSTVHKITRRLCGNYTNHSAKDGSTILQPNVADRWVEHFYEVLNHPQPDEPADPPPHQRQITSTSTSDPQQKRKSETISKL
ncbi:hypothetical protein NP493_829g00009 [Ridgeia piscesae]|uniref:Uncharacterized protein n=1 Tax=Ridgeia piscesae TaxID=27915 RepID=A0AAD9KMY3_RIDPI|nr:hypothetical protein NP493_829g00009 [Ridgeia piscesae]